MGYMATFLNILYMSSLFFRLQDGQEARQGVSSPLCRIEGQESRCQNSSSGFFRE
jgi:hypothetical protein